MFDTEQELLYLRINLKPCLGNCRCPNTNDHLNTRKNQMKITRNITALALSALLIALSACAATNTSESTGQYVDNSVLTAKVKTAIFNEPTLSSSEITVETYKGEVQLSGFVSSIDQTNKAVEIAKSIPGVTAVKNDMRVKGSNNPFYK
jgi:hyperosmotically inducible protein